MRKSEMDKLFHPVLKTDPKTGKTRREMQYIGPHYAYDPAPAQKAAPVLLGCLALCTAAFIGAGFIPAMGLNCRYVMPQFALCALPLYYVGEGVLKVRRLKKPVIDEVMRKDGLMKLRSGAGVLTLLAAAWLVGEIVFMALNAHLADAWEWALLGCAALETAGAAVLLRIGTSLPIPDRKQAAEERTPEDEKTAPAPDEPDA